MDELSPGARSLLQAADTFDDPTAEDAARVRRAVMMRVGAIGVAAAAITAGSTQAKAASVMSVAAKLTAVLAVTAGGVAATWTYVHQHREVAITAPAPRAKEAPKVEAKPVAQPTAQEQLPIVSPEDVKLEEEAPVVKPRGAAHTARPETDKPEKAELNPADLEAEMKLIRGADSALRAGRASEALSLLAEHQAEHPHASLAHEREGLRAIANCQLGIGGATAAAERFLSRSPHSPLAPRLRSACHIGE
jgi:hypothetical protein